MKQKPNSENIIAIIIIALIMAMNPSCKSGGKVGTNERRTFKFQRNPEKQAQKENKLAIKEHRKKQSDNTQESMKRMSKQKKKNNIVRKRSLWDQIFRRNCDKPKKN